MKLLLRFYNSNSKHLMNEKNIDLTANRTEWISLIIKQYQSYNSNSVRNNRNYKTLKKLNQIEESQVKEHPFINYTI